MRQWSQTELGLYLGSVLTILQCMVKYLTFRALVSSSVAGPISRFRRGQQSHLPRRDAGGLNELTRVKSLAQCLDLVNVLQMEGVTTGS